MSKSKVTFGNPVKRFTKREIRELAYIMNATVSPDAGKPIVKLCIDCSNRVTKRYFFRCDSCHAKRVK
jgi:hypothetical protein